MLIERPPQWFRSLFPDVIFRYEPKGDNPGTIYLTFDDGPIPEVTPWVLDILDKFDVKATFFMVGQNIERYPYLLEEVKNRGHQPANHSLHHIRGAKVSPEAYLQDVNACEKYTHTGIYRPSHGWMTSGQLKAVKQAGYKVVMFDLVTRDYSKRLNAGDVVENVKRYARDGSIIVFHDSLKSIEKLKRALPESLEWLQQQGYRFSLIT